MDCEFCDERDGMGHNIVTKSKFIKYKGIELDTNIDGGIHIKVRDQELDLTETEAIGLNDLLGDVIEWTSE